MNVYDKRGAPAPVYCDIEERKKTRWCKTCRTPETYVDSAIHQDSQTVLEVWHRWRCEREKRVFYWVQRTERYAG